jgi:aminoglycoside/choline kinase family phosphotransferase
VDAEKTATPDAIRIETADRANLESLVESQLGRRAARIEGIAAGLGTRRFYRLHFSEGEPASLIARIEPTASPIRDADPSQAPAWLPEPALEPLRQFLEDAGLRVPRSFAHWADQGIDLLEDVGARTLMDTDGKEKIDLYRKACSLVPRLQHLSASPSQIPAFGRVFDRALIETKAWKWLHWTIPGLLDRPAYEEEVTSLRRVFEGIASLLDQAPRRLAHRDFKAENLHLVREFDPEAGDPKEPEDRIVMIDVQGAFMAPPEYDLVCLLYDLQVDLDEDFAMECFRRTLPQLPDRSDPELAGLRFDAIAIVRLCKDLAHLVHAGRIRKDMRRWHEIPRGLALLNRATGRLTRTFPELRVLNSVIPALTLAASSSDSTRQDR